MILTSKTGLHYPDGLTQTKDGKTYQIIGVQSVIKNGRCIDTIYTLKNEQGEYKDFTDQGLFHFFKTTTKN